MLKYAKLVLVHRHKGISTRLTMDLTQSIINPAGEIVLHRCMMKPTQVERSIRGDGQAGSLKSVVDSPFGKSRRFELL